jgi:xanthine dehydrogenase accessory factor
MNNDATLPLAVILGTNEIASAVAVHLRRAGWHVILSYDPFPPVLRRGMAFHDVLFGDRKVIGTIEGVRAENTSEIAATFVKRGRVAVTALQFSDLLPIAPLDVLVDARMQKYCVTPDLRCVARVTIGLGPHFCVGMNCDVAIETKPSRSGGIIAAGATDEADGVASRLGGVGRERFVYSDRASRWHTPVDIGLRVFSRFVLGHLDGLPVHAPLDGAVRGIVRDGSRVPAGVKLVEIDPRGPKAKWTGIDDRGRGIAEATVNAVRIRSRRSAVSEAFAMACPA